MPVSIQPHYSYFLTGPIYKALQLKVYKCLDYLVTEVIHSIQTLETAMRQRLARQARVQEELHHQRMRMDEARLGLAQRRDQAQEQLRRERERLTTRAWWRRPTSLATSSWVRTGGARATATPTSSAPTTTWPPLEASMLANVGDTDADGDAAMEEGGDETRIVRLLDSTRDNLEDEVVEMEVDRARDDTEEENRERTVARGKGRGGKGGRD